MTTAPNAFERLLIRLVDYIGEGILPEHDEDRIIRIEERWNERGMVRGSDLLWLQETLRRLEKEE